MSAQAVVGQRGYHVHIARSRQPDIVRRLTTRRVIDRIATPKPPKPKGDRVGQWVEGRGKALPYHPANVGVTGQVWAACPADLAGSGCWFVVDDDGRSWIMHESTMVEQVEEVAPMLAA